MMISKFLLQESQEIDTRSLYIMLPSREKQKEEIYEELKQTLCTDEKLLPSEKKHFFSSQKCSLLILELKSILDLDDFPTLQPIIEEA